MRSVELFVYLLLVNLLGVGVTHKGCPQEKSVFLPLPAGVRI